MSWLDSDPATESRYRTVAGLEPVATSFTPLIEALFDESWRVRSKGASAPATSIAATSAAGRSCTAARTSATIPLVIAALLSARKWSRSAEVPAG